MTRSYVPNHSKMDHKLAGAIRMEDDRLIEISNQESVEL